MQAASQAIAALRASTLFGSLCESHARQLAALLQPFDAAAEEILFRAGAPADRVLLLSSGVVAIGPPVDQVMGPGDSIGDLALTGASVRTATARVSADGPARGFALDVEDFDVLRDAADPLAAAVLRRLVEVLASRVRRRSGDSDANRGMRLVPETSPEGVPGWPTGEQLAGLDWFRALTPSQRAALADGLRTWSVPEGRLVCAEGAAGDRAFVVLAGTVEVTRERPDHTERLATFGPGRMLGELSLIDGGRRSATCRAAQDAVVLTIEGYVVRGLLDAGGPAAVALLQAICHTLSPALRREDTRLAVERTATDDDRRARLIAKVRDSVIGDDAVFTGPFGRRRIVYADYTASGRALTFIEDFIHDEVLPLYANTHTDSSASGLQTTRLREDARRLVHRSVGGGDDDVVVFCGSGATGAIDKLSQVLGLKLTSTLVERLPSVALAEDDRPVVFIGPYEHHSNELVWRESIADVVTIGEDVDGRLDLGQLEVELRRHAARSMKIGSFSAASNVTGVITDVDAVAIMLHRHGAVSCWDYAAAGPYLPIAMNPRPAIEDGHLAYKDAVFLSPHKFVGGPGTPGVLVAKRSLFANRVPSVPGGGTVTFVGPAGQRYHPDPAVREEAGTPAIVESIRAGLVFALKDAVGADEIRRREESLVRRALTSWGTNPRIHILGNPRLDRLAIVSFGIRHGDRLLHAHFVAALLNDLFGVQARSGCFCAGPYLHRIYGIDDAWSQSMDAEAALGHAGARLAFVRVNFNYFLSETAFDHIIDAVHFIADEGWKLLPLYRFDPRSGLWHHRDGRTRPPLSLHDVTFASGTLEFSGPRATAPASTLASYLDDARRLVAAIESDPPPDDPAGPGLTPAFEQIRWFTLPEEALAALRAGAGGAATDADQARH